jgi:hypothetical protein
MIGNVVLDPAVEQGTPEPLTSEKASPKSQDQLTSRFPKKDTLGREIAQDRLQTRLNEPPPALRERTGASGRPPAEVEISNEQIRMALAKCHGLVVLAAKMLGIARCSLYYRLNKDEDLKEFWNDQKELRLDKTENKLFRKIDKDEDLDAIKFHLSTKGKGRGYVQSVTQGLPQEMPLTINIIPIGTVNIQNGPKGGPGEEPKEVDFQEVSNEEEVEIGKE